MEIGNQYVNCASLKNRCEIREQGKPQIQKQKKKKTYTQARTQKEVNFDKREKKKKVKTWSDRRKGELEA